MDAIMKELPPVPDGAPFRVAEVRSINFNPHPFCITPRHVAYAADHHSGMLTAEAIVASRAPCGIGRNGSPIRGEPPCNLGYHEHTSEMAIFVAIKGRPDNLNDVPGLYDWLMAAKPVAEKHGVAGFAFPSE